MQSQIQQHLLSITTKCHALACTCPHILVILMANQIWKPTWPCLRALSLQSYAYLSPVIRQTTWKRPCISTWKSKFFDITNSSIISQNLHPKNVYSATSLSLSNKPSFSPTREHSSSQTWKQLSFLHFHQLKAVHPSSIFLIASHLSSFTKFTSNISFVCSLFTACALY